MADYSPDRKRRKEAEEPEEKEQEEQDEQRTSGSHAKQNPRISKEDFFAITALWMERCPLSDNAEYEPESEPGSASAKSVESHGVSSTDPSGTDLPTSSGVDKAGAVFVGANDRIVAMDCSRNGVHAAARVLINFPDKVKGCNVYMSRKPCSFCVKLLVQAEVSRILFLPFQPELSPDPDCSDLDNAKRTENLLKVFPVAMSIHKPQINKGMQDMLASSVKRPDEKTFDHHPFKRHLLDTYWSEDWVEYLRCIGSQLEKPSGEREPGRRREKEAKVEKPIADPEPIADIFRCPGLDTSFVEELNKSIHELMVWVAQATVVRVPFKIKFKSFDKEEEGEGEGEGEEEEEEEEAGQIEEVPNLHNPRWQKLARHMSRMALIAARRTDDPSTGVGVILLRKNEVVSVGLNGYPSKANFGDFPRSKDRKKPSSLVKYPYLIHAEQNALLLRNTRDIKDESTTAFISRTPCDECTDLLLEAGVRNVVLPWKETKDKSKEGIKYTIFSTKRKDFRAIYGSEIVSRPRPKVKRDLSQSFED